MLGLANTVSSSSTPESKYSLNFDGADDYLDTGDTFSTTFAGDFSISMWLKPDDAGSGTQYIFGAGNASLNDSVRAFIVSRKVGIVLEAHDSTATRVDTDSTVFSSGAATSWTHLAFVANITGTGTDKTTLLIYVNKVLVAQTYVGQDLTAANHLQFSSDINFILGALNNNGNTNSNSFDGNIADFAIWNVALDADAVTAIYNSGRPTNLTFDKGNYGNSSALVAYYKMGDGLFDDKANGVVHDQGNSVTGSELVTNGNFSADSGWVEGTGFDIGSGTMSYDGSSSQYNRIRQVLTTEVGAIYELKFTLSNLSASSVNFGFANSVGSFSVLEQATYSSNGTHIRRMTATLSDHSIVVQNNNATQTLDIDDVSVKKVHAPGYGNNLVVWDGSTTGDWNETQGGNTTLSANSGKLRATADAAGAYGTSRNFTTVVGAVYKVEGTIDVDNASGGAGNFRVSNNLNLSSQIATLSTSTGTFKSYFTATATTTHVGVIDTADDDTNYMEIEEISVRQLNGFPGITSDADESGFNFTSDTP